MCFNNVRCVLFCFQILQTIQAPALTPAATISAPATSAVIAAAPTTSAAAPATATGTSQDAKDSKGIILEATHDW